MSSKIDRIEPENYAKPDAAFSADRIRQEVDHILCAAPFKQSQRCRALLQHVVERTLDGRSGEIKERSLGIEVFRRAPDYDTNSDPVVRVTAGEVRRRLAQYYQDRTYQTEPRVSLPAGSYIPQFREWHGEAAEIREPLQQPQVLPVKPERRSATARLLLFGGLAAVLAVSLAGTAFWAGAQWSKPKTDTNLNRFWAPLRATPTNVLLSVGELGAVYRDGQEIRSTEQATTPGETIGPEFSPTLFELLDHNTVAWADAVTAARLSGQIVAQGNTMSIRRSKLTSLADLRRSPAVLVGGFNNRWIMTLLSEQRFSYKQESSKLLTIQDSQNPSNTKWRVDLSQPVSAVKQDFGIVARFVDRTTEKPLVIASGIAGYGTIAAAELLTTPAYLDDLARAAPRGWEKRNIEAVFSSVIVEGNVGRPTILAVHTW